jgi:hypothetical protein
MAISSSGRAAFYRMSAPAKKVRSTSPRKTKVKAPPVRPHAYCLTTASKNVQWPHRRDHHYYMPSLGVELVWTTGLALGSYARSPPHISFLRKFKDRENPSLVISGSDTVPFKKLVESGRMAPCRIRREVYEELEDYFDARTAIRDWKAYRRDSLKILRLHLAEKAPSC